MLHPGQGGLDPLRLAILRGDSILAGARDLGPLECAVLHAATVCGRRDDVRILRLADPLRPAFWLDFATYPRRPQSRRLDADAASRWIRETGAPEIACDPGVLRRLGEGHEYEGLPAFDPAEAASGGGILLVQGVVGQAVPVFAWIAAILGTEAAAGSGSSPVLFLDGVEAPNLARDAPLDVRIDGKEAGIAVAGERATLDRLFTPTPGDEAAWDAAEAEERGRPLVRAGYDVAAMDGGRGAAVRRLVDEGAEACDAGSVSLSIHELCEDGWVASLMVHSMTGFSKEEVEARSTRYARLVRSAGISCLGYGDDLGRDECGADEIRAVYGTGINDVLRNVSPCPSPLLGVPEIADFAGRVEAKVEDILHRNNQPQLFLGLVGGSPRLRDFLLTWPCLAELLADGEVREACEAGVEMVPFLSGWLGMREAIVRRLVGVERLPRLAAVTRPREDDGRRHPVGLFLEAIGIDALPGRGEPAEWDAFAKLASRVDQMMNRTRIRRLPLQVARDLLVSLPGRTWEERASPAALSQDDIGDVGDVVASLALWLGWLRPDLDVDEDLAFSILAKGRSLLGLLQASRAWHDDPRLASAPQGLPPNASWPVPFGEQDLGGGWTARVLGSQGELDAEGGAGVDADGIRGLDHCVASYGPACIEGRCIVLSVRHASDGVTRRVSTVELVPDARGDWRMGGFAYRLTQNRGLRNAPPADGAEVEARLGALRRRLASGEVRLDVDALGIVEYGPPSPPTGEEVEGLYDGWRRVLPERLGRLDVGEFRDALTALAAPATAS